MIKDLRDLIHDFEINLDRLDQEHRYLLTETLSNIFAIVQAGNKDPYELNKQLSSLKNYSHKKLKELTTIDNEFDNLSLKKLRNQIIHGGRKFYSKNEQEKYYGLLWKKLDRSASDWDAYELTNFLSYCLGSSFDTYNLRNTEAKEIVKFYKNRFAKMNFEEKDRSFNELIMRLYGDPVFQSILDKNSQ